MSFVFIVFESVQDIAFVVFDSVFREKGAVFILKGARAVVFLLVVDVMEQDLLLSHPDGKCPITLLPGKVSERGCLCFQPFAGSGFDLLHQVSDG